MDVTPTIKNEDTVEYKYYVVASRCNSFVSSSNESSPYLNTSMKDISPTIETSRSPTTRSKLELRKQKLWDEICRIDMEIVSMDRDKKTVLDLKGRVLHCRDSIARCDRSNIRGNIQREKLKSTFDVIMKLCEKELLGEFSFPCFQFVRKELATLKKIVQNQLKGKLAVEEIGYQLGKTVGSLECIVLIYYDGENDTSHRRNAEIDESDGTDTKFDKEAKSLTSTRLSNSFDSSFEISNDKDFDLSTLSEKQQSPILLSKFKRIKQILEKVEKLSSSAPKLKSLTQSFSQTFDILDSIDTCLQIGERANYKYVNDNMVKLRKYLSSEKPCGADLENSLATLGEVVGYTSLLSKILIKDD